MESESIFVQLYESQRAITTSGSRHGHEQTKHQIQPSNSGNMNRVEWPKKRGTFFLFQDIDTQSCRQDDALRLPRPRDLDASSLSQRSPQSYRAYVGLLQELHVRSRKQHSSDYKHGKNNIAVRFSWEHSWAVSKKVCNIFGTWAKPFLRNPHM